MPIANQDCKIDSIICEEVNTLTAADVINELNKKQPLLLLLSNAWNTNYTLLVDPEITRIKDEQHLIIQSQMGKQMVNEHLTPQTGESYTITAITIDGIAIREWITDKNSTAVYALQRKVTEIIKAKNDWVDSAKDIPASTANERRCVIC